MFQHVLQRRRFSGTRLSRGATLSIAAHIVVFAFVAWASTRPVETKTTATEVTFYSPTATGAPGRPPLGRPLPPNQTKTPQTSKPLRKQDTLYKSKDPYDEAPTKPADDGLYAGPIGDPNGDPNGIPGAGVVSAAPPPPPPPPPEPPKPQSAVIPFGPGMERPAKVSGPEPVYPREAREAKVEGKMLVQCVITTEGRLVNCVVLKSLPFMDKPVLDALAQQRWTPVMYQGQPVSVSYTIPFKFVLK